MTKRILAILLTLAMVLSLCSVNIFADDESGSGDANLGFQIFTQDQVNWSWKTIATDSIANNGVKTTLKFDNLDLSGIFNADNTKDYTVLPKVGMQIGWDALYNSVPGDAAEGTLGDSANYEYYLYKVTVHADGYEDIDWTWDEPESGVWTAYKTAWGVGGFNCEYNLAEYLCDSKIGHGLSIEELCTKYLPAVTSITIETACTVLEVTDPDVAPPAGATIVVLENGDEDNSSGKLNIPFYQVTLPMSAADFADAVESITIKYRYHSNSLNTSGEGSVIYVAPLLSGTSAEGDDWVWDGDFNFEGCGTYDDGLVTVTFANLADRLSKIDELYEACLFIGSDVLPVGTKVYLTDVEFIVKYKDSGETEPNEHPEGEVEIDYTVEGSNEASLIVPLPETVNVGDTVRVHVTGSSDGDFRVWTADGGTTMCADQQWFLASNEGFDGGDFDFVFDLVVATQYGDETPTTANNIMFKGLAWNIPLDNFTVTHLGVVVNPDDEADEPDEPDTPDTPAEPTEGYEIAAVLIENSVSALGHSFAGPALSPWAGTGVVIDNTNEHWNAYIEAANTEGARFVMKYVITGTKLNAEGNPDQGWINMFQGKIGDSIHGGFANWEGPAANIVDEFNGEVMPNQWSLLNEGSHVITLTLEDYKASFDAHTCTPNEWNSFNHKAGDISFDDSTGIFFQSGLNAGVGINITDLYVEIPVVEEEPEEPEDPEDPEDPENPEDPDDEGGYILATGSDHFGILLPEEIKAGETVTIRISGTTDDTGFRVFLNNGAWTRCSDIMTSAALGATGDFEIEFKVKCANIEGSDVADCLLFKGPSYGVNIGTLKIYSVVIVKNGVETEIDLSGAIAYADGDVKYVKPTKPAPSEPEAPVKKGKTFAFAIRLSDSHHGYLVNGRMLPMPHKFNDEGVCVVCTYKKADYHAVEITEEEAETDGDVDVEVE